MIKKEADGVVFYDAFSDKNIISAISTRHGGVTSGYLGSMNLGLSTADTAENVRENQRRFAAAAGFSPENLVYTRQEHTDIVKRVGASHRGMGYSRPRQDSAADGLVTNERDVAIFAYFADCVPVLFYDPVKMAIGICHSGWRGTVQEIAAKTVRKMEREFASDAGDIRVLIGPCIGKCCFLVDTPVYEEFLRVFSPENGKMEKVGEKYAIDLGACIESSLRACGVGEITQSGMCTACRSDEFFSHRKTAGRRGLFGAVMMIV